MPDYNTIQRRRNLIVGAFVIVGFAACIYMLFLFGELPIAVSTLRSYTVLVDFPTAPGVQDNTRVNYCGYQVGRVVNVNPPERVADYEKGMRYHRVRVEMAIEKQYHNIPANVKVLLMKRGLGSSYIELDVDPEQDITGFLSDGDLLTGEIGTSTEFIPKNVQDKLESLVDSVTELSGHANEIVGDKDNKAHIKETLSNLARVTEEASATMESVKLFANTGTETLGETSENLNATLKDIRIILAKINEGEGTAGRVINDGRLYEDLLDSVRELELALEQIKLFAAQSRENGLKVKW